MRKLFTVALIAAFLAVGLSLGVMQIQAAFQTISSGMVRNAGFEQFFRDVRGVTLTIEELTETAVAGSYLDVTGLEKEDVIFAVISVGDSSTQEGMINCLADFTIAATDAKVRIAGTTTGFAAEDDFIVGYYDVDNTN